MTRTPYRESLSRLRKSIRAYEAGDDLSQGVSDFLGSLPKEASGERIRASGIVSISEEEKHPLPAPGLDGKYLAGMVMDDGKDFRSAACPSYWNFSREMDFPNGLSVRRCSGEDIIGHPYGKAVFFRWGSNMYAFHALHDFDGDLSRTHESRWHTHIERIVGWDIEEIKPEPPKPRTFPKEFPGRAKGVTIVPADPPKEWHAPEPPVWRGRAAPQRLSIRGPKMESAIDIDYRTFRKGTDSRSITAWRLEACTSGDYEAPLVTLMMGYVGKKVAATSPDEMTRALMAMPLDLLRGLPRRLEGFEIFLTG